MNEVEHNDILHIIDIITKVPIKSDMDKINRDDKKQDVYIDNLFNGSILQRKVDVGKIIDIWYFVESWDHPYNDVIRITKISPLSPARFESLDKDDKIYILDKFLYESIGLESYEEAAIIRDKITSIK